MPRLPFAGSGLEAATHKATPGPVRRAAGAGPPSGPRWAKAKERALRKGLWVNPLGIHKTGPALRTATANRGGVAGGRAGSADAETVSHLRRLALFGIIPSAYALG